jgi:hypothetical protein
MAWQTSVFLGRNERMEHKGTMFSVYLEQIFTSSVAQKSSNGFCGWGTVIGNPEEGERLLLEADTKQRSEGRD